MKTSFKLLLCLSLVFTISSKKVESQSSEFSSDGNIARGAITYGLGSNLGYQIPEDLKSAYKSPVYLEKLPDRRDLLPSIGPTETVQEVASDTEYYDGSAHLNTVKVQCRIYSNPSDCIHQSGCGWCNTGKGSCILGNNIGPLESCLKTDYSFTAPFPNWSPETKVVTTNFGGVSLNVVSK